MKIQLKNIKINSAFSEETICFKADLYVDGTKVAFCENNGKGGSTFYQQYQGKESLLKHVEEYAKTLPSITFGALTLESTLENIIDNTIDEILNAREKAKHKKKIVKLMENNIVYGLPNGKTFKYIGFKGRAKLNEIAKTVDGKMAIEKLVTRVKTDLKEGEVIFNTTLATQPKN